MKDLYSRIEEALYSVPTYFEDQNKIERASASDIFTLSPMLSSCIEECVVETLNKRHIRRIWDPEGEYGIYTFVRQAQTFPDVLLINSHNKKILMGIELKGWCLFAKEGEPSFRFLVTPKVCAEPDLLVIYPWHLSGAIMGVPKLTDPFVRSAREVAEERNDYWNNRMRRRTTGNVILSKIDHPYPSKSEPICDEVENDKGKNFGRIARMGDLLKEFVKKSNETKVCGIEASAWWKFLKDNA